MNGGFRFATPTLRGSSDIKCDPSAASYFDCKTLPAATPRCHSLHSNHVLNGGYAYATIIGSKYHGQTLLAHLASLYPHSTPQVWQQNLINGEVTLNGATATGSESVASGQTLVWNRPPWIEPARLAASSSEIQQTTL